MKSYNYKYLIGFILGVLLFGGSVYAAILYSSNIVSYNVLNSSLTGNNVQAAIDELADKYSTHPCVGEKICIKNMAVGDYISYTPSSTSYVIDSTYTGRSTSPVIDPSELTLWRIISINPNGTIDIISEYVSSEVVGFRGKKGFKNLVGYLNVLASQYENSTYTVGSRYFGYNNQTEFITDDTYFNNAPPWSCSTGETCSPDPDDYEAYGGGDSGYLSDYNLVYNALGTLAALNVDSLEGYPYWMASRYYYKSIYGSDWNAYFIGVGGTISTNCLYTYDSGDYETYDDFNALRPIVTLKSGLSYDGGGTLADPWVIIGVS